MKKILFTTLALAVAPLLTFAAGPITTFGASTTYPTNSASVQPFFTGNVYSASSDSIALYWYNASTGALDYYNNADPTTMCRDFTGNHSIERVVYTYPAGICNGKSLNDCLNLDNPRYFNDNAWQGTSENFVWGLYNYGLSADGTHAQNYQNETNPWVFGMKYPNAGSENVASVYSAPAVQDLTNNAVPYMSHLVNLVLGSGLGLLVKILPYIIALFFIIGSLYFLYRAWFVLNHK